MDENLISSLKLAQKTLDDMNNDTITEQPSEVSLLRLSSALKNIDKEVNKLRDILDNTIKSAY